MGRRPLSILILAALLYGGYPFLQRFQIEGLDKISLRPRAPSAAGGPSGDSYASVPASNVGTVKLATFNIQVFGRSKLDKPEVMQVLAETVRKFDLVAIQEIRSTT